MHKDIFNRKPFVPGFSGDSRSRGPPPLDRVAPPPATLLYHAQRLASASWEARVPQGLSTASERHAQRRFPSVLRHLKRPPPTQIRPYPLVRQKNFLDAAPVRKRESIR
jgi:hypothetical protein